MLHGGSPPQKAAVMTEALRVTTDDQERLGEKVARMAGEADRAQAFEAARKAGGTKLGGVNLVALSAATLQHLVDRKLLTKDVAQQMLNEAKVVER